MSYELKEFPPHSSDGLQDLRNFILFSVFSDPAFEINDSGHYSLKFRPIENELPKYEFTINPEDDPDSYGVIASLHIQDSAEIETTLRVKSDGPVHCETYNRRGQEVIYDFLDDDAAYSVLHSLRSTIKV